MTQPQWLKNFCEDGTWKSTTFYSLNLQEFTPCFEDIVILGSIHTVKPINYQRPFVRVT